MGIWKYFLGESKESEKEKEKPEKIQTVRSSAELDEFVVPLTVNSDLVSPPWAEAFVSNDSPAVYKDEQSALLDLIVLEDLFAVKNVDQKVRTDFVLCLEETGKLFIEFRQRILMRKVLIHLEKLFSLRKRLNKIPNLTELNRKKTGKYFFKESFKLFACVTQLAEDLGIASQKIGKSIINRRILDLYQSKTFARNKEVGFTLLQRQQLEEIDSFQSNISFETDRTSSEETWIQVQAERKRFMEILEEICFYFQMLAAPVLVLNTDIKHNLERIFELEAEDDEDTVMDNETFAPAVFQTFKIIGKPSRMELHFAKAEFLKVQVDENGKTYLTTVYEEKAVLTQSKKVRVVLCNQKSKLIEGQVPNIMLGREKSRRVRFGSLPTGQEIKIDISALSEPTLDHEENGKLYRADALEDLTAVPTIRLFDDSQGVAQSVEQIVGLSDMNLINDRHFVFEVDDEIYTAKSIDILRQMERFNEAEEFYGVYELDAKTVITKNRISDESDAIEMTSFKVLNRNGEKLKPQSKSYLGADSLLVLTPEFCKSSRIRKFLNAFSKKKEKSKKSSRESANIVQRSKAEKAKDIVERVRLNPPLSVYQPASSIRKNDMELIMTPEFARDGRINPARRLLQKLFGRHEPKRTNLKRNAAMKKTKYAVLENQKSSIGVGKQDTLSEDKLNPPRSFSLGTQSPVIESLQNRRKTISTYSPLDEPLQHISPTNSKQMNNMPLHERIGMQGTASFMHQIRRGSLSLSRKFETVRLRNQSHDRRLVKTFLETKNSKFAVEDLSRAKSLGVLAAEATKSKRGSIFSRLRNKSIGYSPLVETPTKEVRHGMKGLRGKPQTNTSRLEKSEEESSIAAKRRPSFTPKNITFRISDPVKRKSNVDHLRVRFPSSESFFISEMQNIVFAEEPEIKSKSKLQLRKKSLRGQSLTDLLGSAMDLFAVEEPVSWRENLRFITEIDWKFVRSIFNIKPFFVPVTKRKYGLYLLYACIAFLSSGFLFPSVYEMLAYIWSLNAVPVLFLYLIIDPLILFVCAATCKYPPLPTPQTNVEENAKIAMVITCHESEDVIAATVRAALVHFPPQNIFIADNGNSQSPLFSDTLGIVKSLDADVNYRWYSIGNKTLAQYLTVRELKHARADISNVLIIDDDVTLCDNLRFPTARFDELTKCLVYGIRGTDEKGTQRCIWTRWQDMEYKMADFTKILQDKYSTVLFPHGAISLWDKDILFDILTDHDAIFYADDVKMGIWLSRRGYRLGYYADALVDTETPETIFGKAPNYYNQRVRSWDFSEHMLTWRHLKAFAFGYVKGSISRTLILKFFQIYTLYTNLMDWIKIPLLIYYISKNFFFFGLTALVSLIVNTASIMVWALIKSASRPDIQVDFNTLLTFPIYKILSFTIRIVALMRCFFVYWPRFKPKEFRPRNLDQDRINGYNLWNRTNEPSFY